jgi:hypothetical protein
MQEAPKAHRCIDYAKDLFDRGFAPVVHAPSLLTLQPGFHGDPPRGFGLDSDFFTALVGIAKVVRAPHRGSFSIDPSISNFVKQ